MLALCNQSELWVIPISSGYKGEVIHDITTSDKLIGPKEDDFNRKLSGGKRGGGMEPSILSGVHQDQSLRGKFTVTQLVSPQCVCQHPALRDKTSTDF